MWVKLVVSASVVVFCTFLGYLAAGKYRARKRFYSQFASFNERFLNELDYARKPLSVFLSSGSYSGEFAEALSALSKRKKLKAAYLTEDERAEFEDYFSMLGRGDAQSQRAFFSARRARFSERSDLCAREAKSRGELYTKLGLLSGLAFVILIV